MPERRRARIQVVSTVNMFLEAALLLDEYLDVATENGWEITSPPEDVELIGSGDVGITSVGTGSAALEALRTESYDCAVLDLHLPDMSGFALLGEMQAHVDRRVRVGEPCTVIGWKLGAEGRKHHCGTAIFDGEGELCARARATWIEVVARA